MPRRLSISTLIDNGSTLSFFRPTTIFNKPTNTLETVNSGRSPHSKEHSLLLSLPAELRAAIYEAVLFQPGIDLALLRACQMIHMETSPMLWQRPTSFPSQAKLFSWIQRSATADLGRVRTLTLRLTDVDLTCLINLSPGREQIISAWSLYQQELEKLNVALQSFPGLMDLTIVPCDHNGSQLLNGMYLSFLGMIVVHLPRLKQLTIHDGESVLEKVPNLKQLSKVVFNDSRSSSSPSGISRVSRGKRRLDMVKHEDVVAIKMEACEMDQV